MDNNSKVDLENSILDGNIIVVSDLVDFMDDDNDMLRIHEDD